MTVMTYPGRLHGDRIELDAPIDLPDGSEVYVVVKPQLDLRQAQKKANGWLVDMPTGASTTRSRRSAGC